MSDLVAIVSIISSLVSILLALFAIWFSRRVEERLRKNFLILKSNLDDNRARAEACLSNINREAEAIKNTVDESHEKIHQTLKEIKNNP